jgi:pimeloyl-ACP methyl ester carboxylesterase
VELAQGRICGKRWTPQLPTLKSPLILLHDSLGCVGLWKDFPVALATSLSRPIIAYDRLGFGESSALDELPSTDFIAEEANWYFPAIKQFLSIQSYVLLGHSVGGGMAISIASRDACCEGVVTVSAQAFVEAMTLQGIEDAKHIFTLPEQMERLHKWHGAKANWVLDAWIKRWLSQEFQQWSLKPCIGDVHCPVLAIHGENDEYGSVAFPKFIVENTSGRAQMLLLKNCGHMPHKEQPDEVLIALKEFMQYL